MKIDIQWLVWYLNNPNYKIGNYTNKSLRLFDGERISIQANAYAYSFPRENPPEEYLQVELGFPTFTPSSSILEYGENSNDPYPLIYPYVPIKLVVDEINLHGGINPLALI